MRVVRTNYWKRGMRRG